MREIEETATATENVVEKMSDRFRDSRVVALRHHLGVVDDLGGVDEVEAAAAQIGSGIGILGTLGEIEIRIVDIGTLGGP